MAPGIRVLTRLPYFHNERDLTLQYRFAIPLLLKQAQW